MAEPPKRILQPEELIGNAGKLVAVNSTEDGYELVANSSGGDGVESVTGATVDNTDPQNPIVNAGLGLIGTTTGNDTTSELLVQGARVSADTTTSSTMFGEDAGLTNIDYFLTAIGYQAGMNNIGLNNTFLGKDAGINNAGGNVTSIGADSAPANIFNNVILIGYDSRATNNNQTVFGNPTAPIRISQEPIATLTSNTTLLAEHKTVLADATGGSFTITLPAASTAINVRYAIKKIDSSINTITIDGNASELVEFALTKVLNTQGASVVLECNGTAWFITASTI